MSYAPIVLFIYNRPDHTKQTLEALAANTLARDSDLFIYADGPKENAAPEQLEKIRQTRELARSQNWCKNVTVIESEKNKGLAASIILGVTETANKYGKVIVLEDDIVTGKYFLEFMNTALDKYENEKKVWHIAGWRDPVKKAKEGGAYFYPTMDCWGWATWADRWQYFKKDVAFYQSVFTDEMKFHFNIEGSEPGMWSQIDDNSSGKINTWAIFWYATLFLKNGLCLAPTKSLVKNIGFDNSGVHCGQNSSEDIKHNLDFEIKYFPKSVVIDVAEYKKNIKFFKKIRRKSFVRKLKDIVKSILRPPYHFTKWLYHHTLKRPPKSFGYIFMLHRVDDFELGHLWCNEHMKVAPEFLDSTIASLKEKYDIIPLSDVPLRLTQKNKRKFIVFTMDDGYKDNYTKALLVFKKHNVPYTIFVATDFPDKKALLWWYELEDLLLKNESVALSNGITYPAHNYQEKCDSFMKIREEILKLNQLDLENELNKLFSNYKINWTSQCQKLCLSWDDIKTLENEPLVTIGAHTKHHYNLKQLATEGDVKEEVQACVELLKQKADINPSVFAYPFGSPVEAGEREFKVLSEFPFTCSCIACGGPCTKENTKNLNSLPRVMFKQDFKMEDLK